MSDHSGLVIRRSVELPAALEQNHVCYTITWEKRGDAIFPSEMLGTHQFLQESRCFKFGPGHGYVGRIFAERDAKEHEDLMDVMVVDIRRFPRKHMALITGISSILFVFQTGGTLREIGFERPSDARAILSLLRQNCKPAPQQLFIPLQLAHSKPHTQLTCPAFRSSTAALSDGWADRGGPVDPTPCGEEHWRSTRRSEEAQASERGDAQGPSLDGNRSELGDQWPSRGSTGHPHSCQPACKFALTPRGCKDGSSCPRCHLCHFTRASQRQAGHPVSRF